MSMNGKPKRIHHVNDIWSPNFSLSPAATTPTLDPIKIPLLPRSAPRAKTH
jgi:hypothetical protein